MEAPGSALARVVQHAPGLLAAVDRRGMFTCLSPSWEELLGTPRAELVALPLLELIHPDDVEVARQELAGGTEPGVAHDRRLRRADGSYCWVQWVSRRAGGELIVTALDIDARKHREREALHDPMTGLATMALAGDRLEAAIERIRRRGGALVALLVDIDALSAINDMHGYAEGDALIRAVGARLADRVRRSDTVARIGGDRFLVIADEIHAENPASVEAVIERVSMTFARPFRTRRALTVLTGSIGVAVSRDGEVGADQLLRDADAALVRAKSNGPGHVEVFDAALAAEVRDRIELATSLRGALQRGELRVVFQPQIDIADGRTVGCEALLRWQHPERGLLAPGEFLRIAEDDGLIVPIGAWVLEQACSQLAAWHAEGHNELTVSVNVSGRQLEQRDFAAIVERILHVTGVPPSHVCLEITETAVLRRPEAAAHALSGLRALGVKIALDDFGRGYSSLTHLKTLPVDAVKVDRSFVADLCESIEDLAVVEAVLAIARRLGVSVIAEGVETTAQNERLRQLGCPLVQGYLYGRPVAPAEVALGEAGSGRRAA